MQTLSKEHTEFDEPKQIVEPEKGENPLMVQLKMLNLSLKGIQVMRGLIFFYCKDDTFCGVKLSVCLIK